MGGVGGKKDSRFRNWLLFCLILFFITLIPVSAGPAFAQDDEKDEFTLEEIVVTGSRIARNNNDSVSPIVTVDEKLFDQSSTMAIETQLNKLPQFAPTIDVPTSGGDIQPTARNTPGEATVALRGIGSNRTLVLINGRRGTPSNGMGVLDINTIPTAAIEYVEAISGGASSTYGADAMAGVLNFIMKDRFEGFELNAQAGMTQEGDNFEYQVSGVMGSNIADDRGNIMMAFSYNERNDALQKDRDWYRKIWADPSITGTQFFPPFPGANLGTGGALPDPDVLNQVMQLPAGAGFTAAPSGATYYVYNGGVFTGFDAGSEPGIAAAERLGLVDGYTIKMMNNGRLGQNNVTNYLIFPMERYNMFAQGNYKINDWIGVFAMGYLSKVHTATTQEPGIITSGWGVNIYPEYNREVIPDELLTILDSRPDPNAPFSIRSLLPMNRSTLTDTQTFNMTAGLEGEIPGIGWTYELFTSHGEAATYAQSVGYASLERTRIVMGGVVEYADDGSPIFYDGYQNFGEGFVRKANAQDGGFGAATAYCTSGINPFTGFADMTDDCWDAIKADVKTRMQMVQDIYEFNTQGRIMDLPGGEMRGAFGLSRRENSFKFLSDTINSEGVSFTDQILGLYPAQDSLGSITVDEAYAELLVPILSDLPFIKQLNLELGGRRSDYDTTGVSYTYKALLDWKVNDYLRFRGGYNRAERAPNIAELFLNPEQIFGVMSYGDVCSLRNGVAPTTANPDTNDEWYEVVRLCGQLMDKAGPDLDETWFYGAQWEDIYDYGVANPGATGQDLVDDGVIPQANYDNTFFQTTGGFGFLWPVNVGNDNLQPEKADTWTWGFVLDSPIESISWLMDWRISLDYYSIEITEAIGEQSADIVMFQCVDPLYNPTYDSESSYCQGFHRDARFGSLGQVQKTFFNNGEFKTSGIDVQINWGMDLGPGRISVTSLVNYLISKESTELTGVFPMVDYTGTFGPMENGLNGNSYEWRALTTVTYAWSDWDLSIRWDWKDKIEQSAYARGIKVQTGAPSYSTFDLLGSYQLFDNVRVRFGCENLFNKEPPLQARYINEPADGMYGGSFSAGNYDTNGRRFYVGLRMYF